MENKKCFVIAPIKDDNSHERHKINDLIENYFKKILVDYDVEISHQISMIGRITSQVITKIFQSDLVIADLTNINGNVMYELGVADTLQKPVIMICENNTHLPFDKYDQRTIMYDYLPYAMIRFESDFTKAVGSLKHLDKNIENTVTQSIGFEYLTQNVDISEIAKNAVQGAGFDRKKASKLVHSVTESFDEIKFFDAERFASSINNILANTDTLFDEPIIKREGEQIFDNYVFDFKFILSSRVIYLKVLKTTAMVLWSQEAEKINYLKTKYSELNKKNVHPIFIVPQVQNAGKSRRGISMLKFSLKENEIVNFPNILADIISKEK